MDHVEHSCDIELVVDFTHHGDNIVHSESEESRGEFDDDEDEVPSQASSSEDEIEK